MKVKELSKHFGDQKAVDAVSFEAKKGRILGFLGPNGAGKSTTMRILAGYMKPDSGLAELNGEIISTENINLKKHIGYLPENTPLYQDMYVREFLYFVADVYHLEEKNDRIEQVIKTVGLSPEAHKKIGMLSKGYKQRVGLAQAIIHNPELLILDEPTSGLDPNQLTGIRQLIKELGKERIIIFSTHIMQEAEAICDDVIIINQGRIVANEPLSSLKEKYKSLSLEEIFKQLTKSKDN